MGRLHMLPLIRLELKNCAFKDAIDRDKLDRSQKGELENIEPTRFIDISVIDEGDHGVSLKETKLSRESPFGPFLDVLEDEEEEESD